MVVGKRSTPASSACSSSLLLFPLHGGDQAAAAAAPGFLLPAVRWWPSPSSRARHTPLRYGGEGEGNDGALICAARGFVPPSSTPVFLSPAATRSGGIWVRGRGSSLAGMTDGGLLCLPSRSTTPAAVEALMM
ncbi:hypothetical protein EJB05_05397, partial [Eragrostis curvula]